MSDDAKEFLSTAETARFLGVTPSKLEHDRAAGTGLPYLKLGRAVRYRRSAIERYLELITVSARLPAA